MLYYKNYSELNLYQHKINKNTNLQLVIKNICYGSVREVASLYKITRIPNKKPLMKPDCHLGVVPQPTDSRLSETKVYRDLS